MANQNHKIKLLCDTNQMAYGSSSALLSILEYLTSINTAFVWGVTEKILASSKLVNETIKINNKDKNLVKENIDLRKFDAVLVISNITNLDTYLDFGIPVFYVDIHFWYPSNKKHRIWQEAKQCFVERYFKNDIKLPNNSIEVGPIISLQKAKSKIKKQVLVNIGGGANRFIKPGENSRYINIILQLLNQLKKEKTFEKYDFIIAGGEASINSIKNSKEAKEFILKSYSKNEFLDTLNKSEYFFTSPGQYATFEGLYLEKKIVFLPPQNASQIIQINILEKAGLINKGLNLTNYYSHFKSLEKSFVNEHELTNEVLTAIEKLEKNNIDKLKIVAHLKVQIKNTIKQLYFQEQKNFIDILGLPGAETIANEIKFALKVNVRYTAEAKYRKRAIKLWNIDPHSLEYLEKRFLRIRDNKDDFNSQFINLLHASETLLFEKTYELDNSKNKIQKFIDKLCYQYETHNTNRKYALKIAFTTTNSKNAVQNLITSAITELEKSKFNYKFEKPIIEFLVVENSTKNEIINSNVEFCNNLKNNKVKINYIGWENKSKENETQKPFQIAQSRTFLINKINSLKWKASNNNPIWILDDDFEFTTTIPAKKFQIENIRLGSVFHRLECIAKENKLDAIVGGNSGSPPIPELSTIKLQLKDLREILQQKSQQTSWNNVLKKIQQNPDYYYDLSRVEINYFSVAQELPKSKNKLDFIDEFLNKLLTGIPASRYLFANYNSKDKYNSAWNLFDNTAVSGGNTIYFNSNLLNSKTYWTVEYENVKSRRADAIWFLLNKQKFKIQKMNFPLTHARTKRITKSCDINSLINNSLKDILGVALWESVRKNKYSELRNIDKTLLYKRIEKRLEKFENNLIKVEQLLNEIAIIFPKTTELISFNTLLNISKHHIKIDYKQINLIEYGS